MLYLLFMFLTFTYFTFYGMMAVGVTPTQHLAAVTSSAFYSLWNLVSGFLIPKFVSEHTISLSMHLNGFIFLFVPNANEHCNECFSIFLHGGFGSIISAQLLGHYVVL